MCDALEAEIAALEAREALTSDHSTGKVTGNMVTDRRLAISKGRTGKDPFATAYRAKGLTLKALAKKVGCSRPLLSMHRAAEDGRPIPRARAEEIEKLIGWPADVRHWPNGIS